MITVDEIRQKALQKYPAVVSALLRNDESIFPLTIPANKALAGALFSDWHAALSPLSRGQKSNTGKGFSIEWRSARVGGTRQQIPARVYFETAADFLFTTGKEAEYKTIFEACGQLIGAFPQLASWAISKKDALLKYQDEWADIISVCRYFTAHPPPHPYYLRELPVPVHTKFIERHSAIIRAVLDQLLPSEWIEKTAASVPERYGLKVPPILMRMRVLDDALIPFLGYEECALPVAAAAALSWQPQRAFIIENQSCYLTFPKVTGSIVIWGEGFKSRLTMHLPWLQNVEIFAWLDLDAAGFQMLHMLREHYRHVKSLLMDVVTLAQFSSYTVVDDKAYGRLLQYLTDEEQEVYAHLVTSNKRLEQERISQAWVQAAIHSF